MNDQQLIIGGILAKRITAAAASLDPSDFADEELGRAFAVLRDAENESLELDAPALHRRLVGNEMAWITESDFARMATAAVSSALVFDAVTRVKAESLKSYLLAKAANLALDAERPAAHLLDEWRKALAHAESFYATADNSFQFISEIVPRVRAVYDDLHAGRSYAVATYMPLTDHLLGDGYSKGDLHVIVGQTGAGKSSIALNHALNQAKRGHTVGIVSREMSDIENVMRLQAADAGIPRWQMRKDMFDMTYRNLVDNLPTLAELPIAFDTRTNDVETLAFNVAQMVEKHNLEILYVDYLQLLSSKTANDTRAGEVQAISRKLKTLAMDTKIPVVALCQFNNGVINASLFDVMNFIRESGSIKQDATTIAYIQVEQTEERKEIKEAKYTVLKNRNGEAFASVELSFNGAQFSFREVGE